MGPALPVFRPNFFFELFPGTCWQQWPLVDSVSRVFLLGSFKFSQNKKKSIVSHQEHRDFKWFPFKFSGQGSMRHNRPRSEIWYVVRFFSLYLLRHHPHFHCHYHNFLWLIGVVNVTVNCCIWNELMFKKESMIKVSQLKDFSSLGSFCGGREGVKRYLRHRLKI